jgi:hypothetical protein
MIGPSGNVRVYLACGVTDMRRGIDGLSALVETAIKEAPGSGAIFGFRGKRADRIKLLWWDGQGFCLFQGCSNRQSLREWRLDSHCRRRRRPRPFRFLSCPVRGREHRLGKLENQKFSYAYLGFQQDGSDPVAGRWSTGPSTDGKGEFQTGPSTPMGQKPVLGPAKPTNGAQVEQL